MSGAEHVEAAWITHAKENGTGRASPIRVNSPRLVGPSLYRQVPGGPNLSMGVHNIIHNFTRIDV
jgi:hypothetical protein